MTVCFPVCAKDYELAIKHARWLNRLQLSRPLDQHRALVCHDGSVPEDQVWEIITTLAKTFSCVSAFDYAPPPNTTWPDAPNWAFQQVAYHMAIRSEGHWLWAEADAVVLRPEWLDEIDRLYRWCGKAFMGPVIRSPKRVHMNGVAVYPQDTPKRTRMAFLARDVAWDWYAHQEIMADAHDASHLFFHAWTTHQGMLHPWNGTAAPDFSNPTILRQIPGNAMLVHRVKTPHLIEHLMAGWRPEQNVE